MKKQLLAIISSSLLLAGCGSAHATIQNANEPIMTVGNVTITAGDEYECDKLANGSMMTMELVKQKIYNKNIEVNDEIKKEAETKFEELAEMYEDIESQLTGLGYKDKDDYITRVLVPEVQSEKLENQYFIDNKEEVAKQFKPSVAKVLQCDDEEVAKKALKALKDGTDFEEVFNTYKSDAATFTDADTVITTESSVPTRLVNTLFESEETGVIDEIFTYSDEDDNTTSYMNFIAVLVDNDYDKIVDQIKDTIKQANSTMSDDVLVFYLKKYNFKVHDQDIFDYLKANNPKYLVSHPELAETEE